jgi:hypothetical protein
MSLETPSTSQPAPVFSLFPNLPKEVRLLMREIALPGPRIIYLRRRNLESYDCSRVWSDKPIIATSSQSTAKDDFFHDVQEYNFENDDLIIYLKRPDLGPGKPCQGFFSPCPAPDLLFVCKESFEVMEHFYARTFGSEAAFPETWFNFDLDSLYVDWGGVETGGISFRPEDFGGVAAKVKHLAVLHTGPNYIRRRLTHEQWLSYILFEFCNLQTLTLVQGRHVSGRREQLAFMKPTDLIGWFYDSHTVGMIRDCTDVNRAELEREREGWFSQDFSTDWELADDPIIKDIKRFEERREGRMKAGKQPWNIPKVERKIITSAKCKGRLVEIAGGLCLAETLSSMSLTWAMKDLNLDEPSTSLTFLQQIRYLELITDEVRTTIDDQPQFLIRNYIEGIQKRIEELREAADLTLVAESMQRF